MISYQSGAGQILICDFVNNIGNEINKKRPVIAFTAPTVQLRKSKLCHVIPLSTTEPEVIKDYHYKLTNLPKLPPPYLKNECWAKCDLVYTVSYERLLTPYFGKGPNGKRNYTPLFINRDDLLQIRKCIMRGLQFKTDLQIFEINI